MCGVLVGLALAVGAVRPLTDILPDGVDPWNIGMFAGVALVLVSVGASAAWIPARAGCQGGPFVRTEGGITQVNTYRTASLKSLLPRKPPARRPSSGRYAASMPAHNFRGWSPPLICEAVRVEAARTLPKLQERILGNIFHNGCISQVNPEEIPHPNIMSVVKRFEGEGFFVQHSASCKCIRFWKPESSLCGPFIVGTPCARSRRRRDRGFA